MSGFVRAPVGARSVIPRSVNGDATGTRTQEGERNPEQPMDPEKRVQEGGMQEAPTPLTKQATPTEQPTEPVKNRANNGECETQTPSSSSVQPQATDQPELSNVQNSEQNTNGADGTATTEPGNQINPEQVGGPTERTSKLRRWSYGGASGGIRYRPAGFVRADNMGMTPGTGTEMPEEGTGTTPGQEIPGNTAGNGPIGNQETTPGGQTQINGNACSRQGTYPYQGLMQQNPPDQMPTQQGAQPTTVQNPPDQTSTRSADGNTRTTQAGMSSQQSEEAAGGGGGNTNTPLNSQQGAGGTGSTSTGDGSGGGFKRSLWSLLSGRSTYVSR